MESISESPENAGRRVAVIGAGLAGLTAAHRLAAAGCDVVVVEKSRGPGGRMSTRREGDWRFDHGAQYFTARHPSLLDQLAVWRAEGVVQRWDARIAVIDETGIRPAKPGVDRYVGVPGMNAVCRHLAESLPDCRFEWEVTGACRHGAGWRLDSSSGKRIEAQALVVTSPPAQARGILGPAENFSELTTIELLPCWAVMLVLDHPLSRDWDAAFVNSGPLSWLASQASKPERSSAHAWVLHANADWSRDHLEMDGSAVCEALLGAAVRLPGAGPAKAHFARAHRWRYALARKAADVGAVWAESRRLALAGDWCAGSRVEGAFLSGLAAAHRILGQEVSG
jgi:predicted NAD/FAD-dependent oxidoreductase